MRYIAAYLLAVLGGNEAPSKDDITAILASVGVDVEQENLDLVFSQLAGKSLDELIAAGSQKFSSMPSGGGGGAAAAAPAASGAAPAKEAPKKEAEKVVEEEDDALDGGFSLFD